MADEKIQVLDHNEKSFAVTGPLGPYASYMKELGVWNHYKKVWYVSKRREDELYQLIDDIGSGRVQPVARQYTTRGRGRGRDSGTTRSRGSGTSSRNSTYTTRPVRSTRNHDENGDDERNEDQENHRSPEPERPRTVLRTVPVKVVIPEGSHTVHLLSPNLTQQTVTYTLVKPLPGMKVHIKLPNAEINGSVTEANQNRDGIVETVLVRHTKNEPNPASESSSSSDIESSKPKDDLKKEDSTTKVAKDSKDSKDSKESSKEKKSSTEGEFKEVKKKSQSRKQPTETYQLVIVNGQWRVFGSADDHTVTFSI